MAYDMQGTANSAWLAISIQIGLAMFLTGRGPLAVASAMIAWRSWKQTSVALSTTEAEYIATCAACSEVVWLRKMLSRLFDL